MLSISSLSMVIAMPLGFLYLLSYSATNHVPIPLSLSELPTLLIVVTLLGTAFVSIFLGIVLLPTITRFGAIGNTHSFMYGIHERRPYQKNNDRTSTQTSTRQTEVASRRKWKNRKLFLATTAVPLFVFYMLLLVTSEIPKDLAFIKNILIATSVIGAFLSIFLGIHFLFKKKKRVEVHAMVWPFLLLYMYWSLIFILLVMKGLSTLLTDELPYWLAMMIVVAIVLGMLLFLYLMVASPATRLRGKPTKLWIALGATILFAPPLLPPVSSFVCSNALKLMRVGGGYDTYFTLKPEMLNALPEQILNIEKLGQTRQVRVILDLGDRVYVRLDKEEPTQVYSIEREVIVAQVIPPPLVNETTKQ